MLVFFSTSGSSTGVAQLLYFFGSVVKECWMKLIDNGPNSLKRFSFWSHVGFPNGLAACGLVGRCVRLLFLFAWLGFHVLTRLSNALQ